jgi:hypothetical protein
MDIRRVFSGLNVIAIGMILLANTLGYLPWGVWWSILSLWPLLLVAAGLDILGKAFDAKVLQAVSGAIVLGGLAFGALVLPAGSAGTVAGVWSVDGGKQVPFDQSLPRPDSGSTSLAVLRIAEGASDLTIGAIDGTHLVTMAGHSAKPVPVLTAVQRNGRAGIDISRPSGSGPVLGASTLGVGLNHFTWWAGLTIEAGASTVHADLADLAVKALDIRTGATSVSTTLGALADSVVDVSAGASSVEIWVPADAKVTVVSDSAAVAADLPQFERTSGIGFGHTEWTYTPATGKPKAGIVINVSMGAGSLKVSTYPDRYPTRPKAEWGVGSPYGSGGNSITF